MRVKKRKTPLLLAIVRWVFPRLEKISPALAHRLFVKIFFTPLNYRVPEKEVLFARNADLFTVEAAGRQIQCYSWGKGPLVIVVHGWAGRATQFRKIIQALVRQGYRVVGFDGPAHGRSEGRSTNILEFEEALNMIYEVVGVPEALVAHSFGGGAVLCAAAHGLRVKKLINIASPVIGDEIINTYLRTIGGSPSTGAFFKSYILKTMGRPFEEFTGLHYITEITQPMKLLLIHDEDDDEVPLRHAEELLKRYPAATLYKTSGLGHTRILKDEAVIETSVSFIKG